MRVGVLTLPLHTNYGGILQAYALQKVLLDMGHEVVLFDSYPQPPKMFPFPMQYAFYLKRIILKFFKRYNSVPVFYEKRQIELYPLKEHVRQFYRNNITHVNFNYLQPFVEEDYDALIVGSDQVWRPMYSPDIYSAYLSFAKDKNNIRRIAYAISFGTEDWEYTDDQTTVCSQLAQTFDAISVREQSAIALCRDHLKVDATWVLDPTMLVDLRHYTTYISKSKAEYPSNMCYSYILDESEDKQRILANLIKEQEYTPYIVKNIDDSENSNVPSVEDWLKAFYDAKFVFTDSFHGCVFSILFNKPFVVYGNKERGMARFKSLLSMFGLDNRLISSPSDVERVASEPIDWDAVNKNLSAQRERSHFFLVKALNINH